jgi:hypothetical protein
MSGCPGRRRCRWSAAAWRRASRARGGHRIGAAAAVTSSGPGERLLPMAGTCPGLSSIIAVIEDLLPPDAVELAVSSAASPQPLACPGIGLYGGDRTICPGPGDCAEQARNRACTRGFRPLMTGTRARSSPSRRSGVAHAAADIASHRSPSGASRDPGCRDRVRLADVHTAGKRSNLATAGCHVAYLGRHLLR